jgi:TonB family protein
MIWCALLITRPGADAVRRPLKLEGVPLAIEQPEAHVAKAAPAPAPEASPPADFQPKTPAALPVIVEARVVERVEPVYPPDCEANAGAVETVDVAFTVTPAGRVVSERVIKSSNHCFERAGLNAVKRWRFEPRTIDGAPRPAFEQQASFRFVRPS